MSGQLTLYVCSLSLLLLFVLYIFLYDHKKSISDDQIWLESFSKVGIDPQDMTHDDTTWYYRRISTCVGYGDWNDQCPKYENYCSSNKKFGTPSQQALAIKEALLNGGTHELCPLIYAGTN